MRFLNELHEGDRINGDLSVQAETVCGNEEWKTL